MVAAASALAAAPQAPKRPPAAAPSTQPSPLEVERALKNLRRDNWILQAEALRLLTRWRIPEAAGPIRAVVAGRGSPWVRGKALVALAELLGGPALEDALAQTASSVPELRAAAVESLGLLGLARGTPAVRKALNDADPLVRGRALVAIARLRGKDAWQIVSSRLAAQDTATVKRATRALAYVPAPEARKMMLRQIEHAERGVRAEAAEAMRVAHLKRGVPVLLRHMATDPAGGVRAACEKTLAAFDADAVAGPLMDALRSGEPRLYPAALKILALHPTPQIARQVAAVFRQPRDPYAPAAPAALAILGRVNPDDHKAVLIRYLNHPAPGARAAAAAGLGRCTQVDHFALLKSGLVDPHSSVRESAYKALAGATRGAPTGGIVRYLAEPLGRKAPAILSQAVGLLGERITPAEVPQTFSLLRAALAGPDGKLRRKAAQALGAAADQKTTAEIAATQGCIVTWRIIAFPEARNATYPPEWEIDFAKTYEMCISGEGASARVSDATCAGRKKRSIVIRPPSTRSVFRAAIATYLLHLPSRKNLRLKFSVGLPDGNRSPDGACFELRVAGKKVFEKKLPKPSGWHDAEVDLSGRAGTAVAVELFFNALDDTKNDELAVGLPRVVCGDEQLIDLTKLKPPLPVRISFGDKELPAVGWKLCGAGAADGTFDLTKIFEPRRHGMAYAVADVDSPAEQKVRLTVFANLGFVLRLNGETLAGKQIKSCSCHGELRVIDTKLKKGPNRFLMKVPATVWTRAGFHFRVRAANDQDRPAPLTNTTS